MARVLDATGSLIAKAAISSISYSVYTVTSGVSQPVLKAGPTALAVNSVWYDSLQTGNGWTDDAEGFTFATTLPASCFTGADRRGTSYQVEIRGTPTSGDLFWIFRGIFDVTDALSIVS